MHILLGILKIAGIILLIILGLLLLILAVVLFTPVRYRGHISTGGDIVATKDPDRLLVTMNAVWIPKLAHVSFELKEKKIRLSVKAVGKTIIQKGEEPPAKVPEAAAAPEEAKAAEKPSDSRKEEPEKPEQPEKTEESSAAWFYQTSGEEPDSSGMPSGPEAIPDGGTPEEDESESGQSGESSGPAEKAARFAKQKAERLRKISDRISGSLDGLAARIYQKAADLIFEVLEQFDNKTDLLGRKAEEIGNLRRGLEPFTDWVSRGYYGWFLHNALKAIRHFRVRRIRGHIRFGTGRPDLTGLMGGAICSLLPVDEIMRAPEVSEEQKESEESNEPNEPNEPNESNEPKEPEKPMNDPSAPGRRIPLPTGVQPCPVTERNLVAEADFYRLKLDVNTDFKGHIRLCHVAWLGLRTVCKRDTWMMFRKIKNRRR